jgi:hypothetical protein
MKRNRLPNRRACETYEAIVLDSQLTISEGYDGAGVLKEIFVNITDKSKDSHLEAALRDEAVLVSHSLQRGATVADLAHSVVRNPDGSALTHIGVILDSMVTA